MFRDGEITIEVGTVHSAKGETHKVTLYLETSYMKNLKLAHVAMSRPTHLLAFACCKQIISGHEESLAANGWKIISCENMLPKE